MAKEERTIRVNRKMIDVILTGDSILDEFDFMVYLTLRMTEYFCVDLDNAKLLVDNTGQTNIQIQQVEIDIKNIMETLWKCNTTNWKFVKSKQYQFEESINKLISAGWIIPVKFDCSVYMYDPSIMKIRISDLDDMYGLAVIENADFIHIPVKYIYKIINGYSDNTNRMANRLKKKALYLLLLAVICKHINLYEVNNLYRCCYLAGYESSFFTRKWSIEEMEQIFKLCGISHFSGVKIYDAFVTIQYFGYCDMETLIKFAKKDGVKVKNEGVSKKTEIPKTVKRTALDITEAELEGFNYELEHDSDFF